MIEFILVKARKEKALTGHRKDSCHASHVPVQISSV
jgi:hypothetical protein